MYEPQLTSFISYMIKVSYYIYYNSLHIVLLIFNICCYCHLFAGLIQKLSLADVVTSTSDELPPYRGKDNKTEN